MHFFYSEVLFEDRFILDGEEAQHAHVLRIKPKEKIAIVNGKGIKFTAEVNTIEKKGITGKVIEKVIVPRPSLQLTIALSPTKNIDRYEWFIEKATELGVLSFIPLITFQSERRQLNVERMKKIILAAMKQSGRALLPSITEPCSIKDLLSSTNADQKYIAHSSGKPIQDILKSNSLHSNVTVMVGPEGDFTDEELSYAMDKGFVSVSLGEYRLRTETAGLKIAALLG